jgi:hypothetical protein
MELTFANNLLRQIGEAQIEQKTDKCELCGRELEENDWSYEFDGGHKWCASCYQDEKCQ